MESFFTQPASWFGLFGTALTMVTGNLVKKYVIPFLKIGKRKKYAGYIALIADEVTDDLRSRYPDKKWLEHIDHAIDQLVSICSISPEIARRAIGAAANRKQQ